MIRIEPTSNTPYYRQIKNQFRELIFSGFLKPRTRLPSTRTLARNLGVNRNTVLTAYEELEADGLVHSHVGQGTFVLDPVESVNRRELQIEKKFNWSGKFSSEFDESAVSSLVQLYRICISRSGIVFGGAHPDGALYPLDLIKRCFNAVTREKGSEIFGYGPIEGYLPLREQITKKMKDQNIAATSDHIFITSGSQQALAIASRILIEAGDYIITEEPTYTGALSVFQSRKARIIGVPLEKDGMNLDALEKIFDKYNPKLIYTMPNFQNPTGITLSMHKRKRLMFLAEKHQVPVIEDDVSGDLRFEGENLPPLKAFDRTGQVIYVGSLSKALIPGFRVGWAVINESLRDRFIAIKQSEDLATNTVSQAILYKFCARGYLKAHLRKVRRIYRERRNAMIKGIKKHFPKNIEIIRPEGGLFLWVRFPEGTDLTPVFEKCMQSGEVIFSLGSLFSDGAGGKNGMRLTFAANTVQKIEEGTRILGEAIPAALGEKKIKEREPEMIPML